LVVLVSLIAVGGCASPAYPAAGAAAISFLTTVVLITRSMLAFSRGALKLSVGKALAVAVASTVPLWLPFVALAIARAVVS